MQPFPSLCDKVLSQRVLTVGLRKCQLACFLAIHTAKCGVLGEMVLGIAAGDSAPPRPLVPHVVEDPRTTSFLREALDRALVVADRRDLIPLQKSWQSNYSRVVPVKLNDKVYALKEPAVSASSHKRLLCHCFSMWGLVSRGLPIMSGGIFRVGL